MAISKVIYGNQTVIDITDTTATASEVFSGKYFYNSAGEKVEGTASQGGGMVVVESEDPNGGTIVEITGELITLQAKSATPSESSQSITADSSYTGLSVVTVNAIPSQYIVPAGSTVITENGVGYDVAAYASVTVSVSGGGGGSMQSKYVAPTENVQTVVPDVGYDGLSSVEVDAIPSSYVGSAVTRRAAGDLTASGSVVTVPSGYYSSQVTKAVASAAHAAPTVSINGSGLITASHTQTAGYVTAGTTNATLQLTTKGATTATPSTVEQTIVNSGVYTTGAIKVAAMSTATHPAPTISVSAAGLITASHTQAAGYVTAGTSTATQQLTTQAAATITPTTSAQTAVAAGRYTTGAVTVAAIPAQYKDVSGVTATASDVVAGKSFVNSTGTVNGSLVIQHYYTGSGAPAASLGNNGDIYLRTS